MACDKQCFTNRKKASHALRDLRGVGMTRYYWCNECAAYHLTSTDNYAKRKIRIGNKQRKNGRGIGFPGSE